MAQPRVWVYLGISLDGFIAREDGSLDWLTAFEGPDYGYASFMASIDTLLLGRRTYEDVLGFGEWPFAGKRVAVLTSRPLTPQHGEVALAGPLESALATLGEAGAERVYADGGTVVRQALLAGVVEELTLTVVPVLLGGGRRLFEDCGARPLELAAATPFENGAVQLRYRCVR